MNSLILAAVMMGAYVIAYHTYGKYLARRIFRLDPRAVCPSRALRDNHDFVPTRKHILFGHHFTSIAGLGPIVGPAIGIIWGWVPAVLWVLLGSIFMGAVHDLGAMVVSLRHQGRSIGDLTADLVSHRVRTLFLLIIFFLLLIVIAVFALIVAILFTRYPAAVIPVWLEIPIALCLGYWIYNKGKAAFWPSILAVIVMYVTVVIGAWAPVDFAAYFAKLEWFANPAQAALITWIILVLLLNAWLAASLPVHRLLQPRDFINSHQLVIAMALLTMGVIVSRPPLVAPALNLAPAGAPPMWPFLFVTIACGAISGFHSLVSSGTSSKQCIAEPDALFIGYGSMLWEGALAALVIVAVAGGIGLGLGDLTGAEAFNHHYASWSAASGLGAKLDAFIYGSANMLESYHMPPRIAMAIMAVFIVSFAGTTIDSATRIQRYVVVELATACKIKPLANRQVATAFAVLTAAGLAFYNGSGKGALTLWPLFGCLNQLLAGLALLVVTIYLARRGVGVFYTAVPMAFMIFMTAWAMVIKIADFYHAQGGPNWLLLVIAVIVFLLEVWMIIESIAALRTAAAAGKKLNIA